MKTHLSINRPAGGFTYLTVVITMIVVGFMLAAYLKMVSVQNQLTIRSQTWNRSVPVLEAGVEEAMAHLNKNGSPDAAGNLPGTLTSDGWTGDATIGWSKFAWLEKDFYFVQISPWVAGSYYPNISSTGYVLQLPSFALNRPLSPFVASVLDDLVRGGKFSRRIVQCATTNNPTYTRGLVAKKQIDLNGRNVETDSYDSLKVANSTNGRYDPSKALDHGDIASNDTITNSVLLGNAIVRGNVATGPNGTIDIGDGVVGDAAFCANPANKGKIQTGHSRDDMNVEFPDIILPAGSSGWSPLPSPVPVLQPDGSTVNTILLLSGNYLIPATAADMSGKNYLISGNVQLRVDSGVHLTGVDTIRIDTNSNLKLYANCNVDIQGHGVVNPGLSTSLQIFGTPACKSIALGGNAEFTGTIYAPDADAEFDGSGSGWNDFSGAAMVKSAKFNGNFKFHFDEALPKVGLWRGFTITSWNER